MNSFSQRLKNSMRVTEYDLDKDYQVHQEVRDLFVKQIKKARRNSWLRLLAGVAITVYGAIGIRYNSDRYVSWALFTALVGFITVICMILWYWVIQAKLTILREIQQLRLEVNRQTISKEIVPPSVEG